MEFFEFTLKRCEIVQSSKIPKLKPWQTGLIVGLLAALIQIVYNLIPQTVEGNPSYKTGPVAYGYCMFCHVRDLVNWSIKGLVPWMTPAPISAVVPALTIIGIIVGAALTAIAAKEFSWRRTINPALAFIYGSLVAFFAAILGACPIRIMLRLSYFDVIGLIGLFSVILGAITATEFVLKRGGGGGGS